MTWEGLRPAGAGDVALLATLQAAAFPEDPWPVSALTALLESPGVAGLIGGADPAGAEPAAGFVVARVAADEAEIITLAVAPEARRAGLGRRLLTGAMAWTLAAGATALFLEVAEDNPAAFALYRGADFHPVGRRPGYYRRATGAVAAIVLRCRLPPLRLSPP